MSRHSTVLKEGLRTVTPKVHLKDNLTSSSRDIWCDIFQPPPRVNVAKNTLLYFNALLYHIHEINYEYNTFIFVIHFFFKQVLVFNFIKFYP